MKREVLRMERVTYKEGDVTLLENFELNIFEGEIVGLLPLNAYGLEEFLQILSENIPLYDGYIYYRERMVDSWRDMKRNVGRICIIQDRSSLVQGQSVLTNVFILRHGFRQEVIQKNLLKRQLQPFLDDIGVEIPADMMVEKLNVFERVVVELLRAVVAGYKLIVLREIGTLISGAELERLYGIMRHYTKQGFSFLYISPHFEEIAQICERTAIMSNGAIMKILRGDQMTVQMVATCGLEYQSKVRKHLEGQRLTGDRESLFEAKNISGGYIKNLNLQVAKGEYVVIQSLNDKVFLDLAGILLGENNDFSGELLLSGERVNSGETRKIAVISERPASTMLFYGMSYLDNLCFTMDYRMKGFWLRRKLKKSIQNEYRGIVGEEVFSKSIEELTENEKNELVYTRILLQKPEIVFCIQPFKGADLKRRIRIWELQEMLLKKGIAVVVLAVNMADALSLADRVIRIDVDGYMEEYSREEFGELPVNVPWKYLYDKQE